MISERYKKYLELIARMRVFNKTKIPLCAAENATSDFVKSAEQSGFENKYGLSGLMFNPDEDFIGGELIFELHNLVREVCADIYGALYSDVRTLSGMNCLTTIALSICKPGDRVLVTSQESGGHASAIPILERIGAKVIKMPFDYPRYDIDYDAVNVILATEHMDFILFCQSDIIKMPDLTKLNIPQNIGILYDATQTLGLIAAKVLPNPMDFHNRLILFGGTHKTLPGPTCGLAMTRCQEYVDVLDRSISPTYIRNNNPSSMAAVLLMLIEQQTVGAAYQNAIVRNANYLGAALKKSGLKIAQLPDGDYSQTHQLFILMPDEYSTSRMYLNAIHYGITLNKKAKPLFGGFGIRIGVQEVTGYGYLEKDLDQTALLIRLISKPQITRMQEKKILKICSGLAAKKTLAYAIKQ